MTAILEQEEIKVDITTKMSLVFFRIPFYVTTILQKKILKAIFEMDIATRFNLLTKNTRYLKTRTKTTSKTTTYSSINTQKNSKTS